MAAWNAQSVRKDFVLLENTDRVYFDNAATSQKPQAVLDATREFYEKYNANVLRGLYPLSVEATERYEQARQTVRQFIHAACPEEIIFTRNTTESMNLGAYSYGMANLKAGDEIVVSAKAYAKSVEVQNENEDLVLSDNYFDLNADEKRVKVISGSTENLRLRSVYDIK